MIDRKHDLPVTRQCQLLGLNRSSVYYQPMGCSDEDLLLMRLIDEIHLKRPFYGSRRIRNDLQDLKYEEVYLKAYETVAEARSSIGNYFRFYNRERRHQSLDRQTPDQVYEGSVMWPVAA